MELDGTAIKSGGCLSVLVAARTSRHGTPAVTAVTAVRDSAKLVVSGSRERRGVVMI